MEAFFDQYSPWPFEAEEVDVDSIPQHARNSPSDKPSSADSEHEPYASSEKTRTRSEMSFSDEDTRTVDGQSDEERNALDDSEVANESDVEHETVSRAGSLSDEETSQKSDSEETQSNSSENTGSHSAEDQPQDGAQNTTLNFGKRVALLEPFKHIPSRLSSTFDVQESSSITISVDFSHIAKVEERQFLALRTSIEQPPSPPYNETKNHESWPWSILEYYEGILILTSNRVGTFDEAFKSRIQLALHYPALGPYERLQIWQNFLERLEKLNDSSIDTGDLRDHLYDLKEEEMNGRQIRNAITSARQYARWKGETLTYTKLKDVIEVAGRFDKYLVKLHKGLTYDQLAEDEGLRLG
ncbi:hypothetical protein GGR51DRAFT_557615 [Nemania sp. FL0031]|nr:hypothetical protein GGR51DRAFT_557615 [Nemania sp. FL0031]